MDKLAGMHTETDIYMFAFNPLFGDARIIWVSHEINVSQTLHNTGCSGIVTANVSSASFPSIHMPCTHLGDLHQDLH
jgi:hypothetical protein